MSKEKNSKEDDERLSDWLLRDNDVFDVPFPSPSSSSSSSQQRPQQRPQNSQSRPYNSQQQQQQQQRPQGTQERAPTQYQQRPQYNQSRPGNFQQQQQPRAQGFQDSNQAQNQQSKHQFNQPRNSGQFQPKTQGRQAPPVVKKETRPSNEVDAFAEEDDVPLDFEEDEEYDVQGRQDSRAVDRRFTEKKSQESQTFRYHNLDDFIRHLDFPIGPSDRINLVDQLSRMKSEPYTISQAFQMTRGTDLVLKSVSPVGKDGLPTFRLFEIQALMKMEQRLRDSEADDNSGQMWSLKERGDSETKEIRIKLGIWENDLNTKLRKLEEILTKGKKVQIVILPRKYEPEKPEMSDLLTSMVKKLEAVGSPSTPQIFVGNRLTCTLIPNVQKEKPEKSQDKYKNKKFHKNEEKQMKLPHGLRLEVDL
eukprot:TRINITY_DN3898_c0_g1_i1.p1 TRINITY_DN3898_c0_g1~~TRINITY_DN3898_c0_g1_i1.p1  ORF type:complete len:470 (+),score=190.76 TRINITY_DN3898_c0_g1_i1:152-1411(+)